VLRLHELHAERWLHLLRNDEQHTGLLRLLLSEKWKSLSSPRV
jgi:hypothetical protein